MKREKGVIFNIKKYSIHDGPGIRTTVFLKGCPLQCWWCQNPEGQNAEPRILEKTDRRKGFNLSCSETKEIIGREVSVQEIMQEIEKDIVFYDESGGGVTFSGGEPLMQPDFLCLLLTECKKQEIHTAVDTCGYAPSEIISKISEMVDLFLYDLKIMDKEKHLKYTGATNELILDNLKQISKEGHQVVIRIPIVPGITDTTENMDQIWAFISRLKTIREVSLLPYNQLGKEKYKRFNLTNKMVNVTSTPSEKMREIKNRFENRGYRVKIGG